MSASILVDRDLFNCPICLDLLTEPVTIPCGHSYCMGCIQDLWENDREGRVCPQCKENLSQPSINLNRNTILAEIVSKLKNNPELQPCTRDNVVKETVASQQKLEETVKQLQKAIVSFKESVLDDTSTISELKVNLEWRINKLEELITAQENVEVSQLDVQLQGLEQKIVELKNITRTQEDQYILQPHQDHSNSQLSEDLPSINFDTKCNLKKMKSACICFKEQLEGYCNRQMTPISNTGDEVNGMPVFKPVVIIGTPVLTEEIPSTVCTKSSVLNGSRTNTPPNGTTTLTSKKGPSNVTKPAARGVGVTTVQ
ncbi:hypothetical protein DPEC_G00310570 [Dallia pectoralis]|uniref:Uncharacterized protein n=1 Tax=Dallia pectoralis TaxID=75939 RepID=A0ACC2FF93_DALPE|nr:hypothetical protein DPEC_G00310570 [Dallia pectoralis]